MLVVTHDPRLVPFADRIVHIEDGTIVREEAGGARSRSPGTCWKGMGMSKRNTTIVIVLLGWFDRRRGSLTIAPASDRPCDADDGGVGAAERQALAAVAPGRVEPPSGIIKVAAPTIGIVSKVLVKVNDTVFAGEPLILLNDDEIMARYAAAEAQAAMRRRLRDEQAASGKAGERRRAEDAVAEAETAVFDAQTPWTRPRRHGARPARRSTP